MVPAEVEGVLTRAHVHDEVDDLQWEVPVHLVHHEVLPRMVTLEETPAALHWVPFIDGLEHARILLHSTSIIQFLQASRRRQWIV